MISKETYMELINNHRRLWDEVYHIVKKEDASFITNNSTGYIKETAFNALDFTEYPRTCCFLCEIADREYTDHSEVWYKNLCDFCPIEFSKYPFSMKQGCTSLNFPFGELLSIADNYGVVPDKEEVLTLIKNIRNVKVKSYDSFMRFVK